MEVIVSCLSIKKSYYISSLLLMCVLFAAPVFAADEVLYNKYNIHTQSKDGKKAKASYANYVGPYEGHVIVPPGTKMVITKKSSRGFTFTYDAGQKKVVYEFHTSRMGMSIDAYLEKITSAKPTALKGLSKLDRKGVSKGKALVGMSREGVMAALGYPATHRTPSLEATSWVYWKNRFATLGVDFDDSGKVKGIRGD